MDQQKVFSDVFERKYAFLDHKNIGSKNHQNLHFFKGVSRWFLSKIGDFLIFQFLRKMDQEKVFCEGSEGKESFLDHKNIGSKNLQNFPSFKGVSPWFLSKNGDFFNL